jgi:hypothetical protein
MLISVLDFVEGFGANTELVRADLLEIQGLFDEARRDYLELNLEASISTLDASLQRITHASGEAFELKDRALLWIYVIEWLAVSGTLMISGALLYTIMVKRRLFKEARATRFLES